MAEKNHLQEKSQNPFSLAEEEVLNFWDRSETFQKSVAKTAPKGDYVFYDGPPFGTGEPHYGHILSSVSKDVVPRYWTMRGYRVERRWGWDCHGLPIENIIEKDLGISGKKQIEETGVAKFNESCRARVLEYADIWDKMVRRIGRWVDFKNSYKTMDCDFMESVWWGFKELYQKKLVYEGRKVLLYCPRCETPVSNFEVAMDNSYKDISETSVYVKFKVNKESLAASKNKLLNSLKDKNVYIVAWTTTPWTLPGNVALAIGEKIKYIIVHKSDNDKNYYILAEESFNKAENHDIYQNLKSAKKLGELEIPSAVFVDDIPASKLIDLKYEPLFDVPELKKNGNNHLYSVLPADFVTTEDGTGVVHTAVVYGEEDYELGVKFGLPVLPALDEKGFFNDTVPEFKGVYFKDANPMVIEKLKERELLFAEKKILHSYPHCHRCDTQLFYNAIPAWFIAIDKIRKRMLELNEKINWFPAHLKKGRFALGIEQAPDWNISRNRYFATPIPVWKCGRCSKAEIIGSIGELRKKSGAREIKDIHSHYIDSLGWECECGGKMKRIKEVFDCWVESGSMSFAQLHYPFENKEKFENNFPAQFISEYISQTRAWFYVMHVMSSAIFDSNSFENVIATGIILNEKGEKMSKSKKNYPDPWKVIHEFGVDALRFYLMSSPVMRAENLYFNERDLRDVFRKNLMILWNVYKFYEMFAGDQRPEKPDDKTHTLDRWITVRLKELTAEMTQAMDAYDLPSACRPITAFIEDFSTWYLRRSRDRFKSKNEKDKKSAIQTTGYILTELSKLIAPFMPFVAERIWQKVSGLDFSDENRSVHLEAWPESEDLNGEEKETVAQMAAARKIVELGLAQRDKAGVKVRQILAEMKIKNCPLGEEYLELVRDEMNVKKISVQKGESEAAVELDTALTPELELEGLKRELVRTINAMRKKAGLTINDKIILAWKSEEEKAKALFETYGDEIAKEILAEKIENSEAEEEMKINGIKIFLTIRKR